MAVLVTGVPGVGKTSLCDLLVERWPDAYVHVRFGELIRDSLSTTVEERDLRLQPTQLVDRESLDNATERLLELLHSSEREVLVDSHAVAQDEFGFVARPDGLAYFSRVRYSAIVQLFADPTVVLRRSDQEVTGRRARNVTDLERHFVIQSAVSTYYAGQSACPLYFVNAEPALSAVATAVNALLRHQ